MDGNTPSLLTDEWRFEGVEVMGGGSRRRVDGVGPSAQRDASRLHLNRARPKVQRHRAAIRDGGKEGLAGGRGKGKKEKRRR